MLFQELIQVYQTSDDFNIRCDAEQQIKDMVNNAIKMESYNNQQMDVFNLHGKISICEIHDGVHDYTSTGTHTYYSMKALGFEVDEFFDCESPEEIKDTFNELLTNLIKEKLL